MNRSEKLVFINERIYEFEQFEEDPEYAIILRSAGVTQQELNNKETITNHLKNLELV